MKTIHHTIELDKAEDTVRFRNLCDIHIGNIHCDRAALNSVVSNIKDTKHFYWFGGGDYGEYIDFKDRRYRASEIDPELHGKKDIVGSQVDMLGNSLAKISNKCLGFVEGNHEITASNFNNRDIIRNITEATTISPNLFLGFRGYIVVHFKIYGKIRYTLTFFITHGTGSSRLPSGHTLYLSRFFQNYSTDIALAGHRHVCVSLENSRIVPRGTGTELRTQYALLGGSFLTRRMNSVATHYVDRAEYTPSIPGGYEIVVTPAKRKILIERTQV